MFKVVDSAYKSPNNIWTALHIHRHSNSAADRIAEMNKHTIADALRYDRDAIVRACVRIFQSRVTVSHPNPPASICDDACGSEAHAMRVHTKLTRYMRPVQYVAWCAIWFFECVFRNSENTLD